MKHLKKLKGKNTAMDSINMLKIAEHINEDSSEHRSYEKGQDMERLEPNEKAEKVGDDPNAASPPRSGGSEADMKATSVQ